MEADAGPFVALVPLPEWVEQVLRSEAAMVLDRSGRLVAVSIALEQMLRTALRERLGSDHLQEHIVHPAEREKAGQLRALVLSGRAASMGVRAVTVTHQWPTGEPYSVLAEYHPVFDSGGELAFHLLVNHEPDAALSEPTLQQYGPLLEATLARLAATGTVGEREPDPEVASGIALLSDREQQVLEHLLDGGSAKEIAAHLHLSVHTVKSHTRSIFEKMGVHSRAELLARFVQADPVGVNSQE